MKLVAFKGFNNKESITVKRNGSNYDMTAAGFTSAKLYIGGQEVTGTISGTTLEFELGGITLDDGTYYGEVALISTTYPDGLIVAGNGLAEPVEVLVQ